MTERLKKTAEPPRSSRLILEDGRGGEQTLYEWPMGQVDQHCELVWAGDLDGDGLLDLVLILSDHYNVRDWSLFLSSKRTKGQLVERVAVLHAVGC